MDSKVFFSVKYTNPEYDDEIWAADWKWRNPSGWSLSHSPVGKMEWELEKIRLDELAREAILDKFGLMEYERELPIRKLKTMSPARLAGMRKQMEAFYDLPHLEIISDNVCEAGLDEKHNRAEDYQ